MAVRRGVWALARFLHRNHRPGEKEKNALAGCQPPTCRSEALHSERFGPHEKAFFSFSPASGTNGAQKRAKASGPGPFQNRPRLSRIVSGFPAFAVSRGAGVTHESAFAASEMDWRGSAAVFLAAAGVRERLRGSQDDVAEPIARPRAIPPDPGEQVAVVGVVRQGRLPDQKRLVLGI